MPEFVPAPADLADLIVRMCVQPWPTTEQDRGKYFTALQLHDGNPFTPSPQHDDPDSASRRFTTSLPGRVDGDCTMFQDQFLGLALFAYMQSEPDAEPPRIAYLALQRLISAALGNPVERWGPSNEPACLWRPPGLVVEMHCFQRLSSAIMVGIAHAERSTANDAAARTRHRNRPHPSAPVLD